MIDNVLNIPGLTLDESVKRDIPISPERQIILDNILKIYGKCFWFSKELLVGKELKSKFETVEKTIKSKRRDYETKLKNAKELLDKTEKEYKEAIARFENQAMEELDPTKYDTNVAPIEEKYNRLFQMHNQLSTIVQGLKMEATSLFAKDKKMIPTLVQAHAVFLTLKIVIGGLNGEITTTSANELDVFFNECLSSIRDNREYFTEKQELNIDTLVDVLWPVAQHSVDLSGIKARNMKDEAFGIIDKFCDKYNIECIKPDLNENDTKEQKLEKTLMIKANQIKALQTVIKNKTVKNPDGSYTTLPVTDDEISELMYGIREAQYSMNGLGLMDKEVVDNFPFRRDTIRNLLSGDLPRVTRILFDDKEDNLEHITIVSTIIMSLVLCNAIPRIILYM